MLKKIIVITGTTSGIGEQTALALAKQGHTIYMLVRSIEKGEIEKRTILVHSRNDDVHTIECDLASLASVKQAANELASKTDHIDVLINNAGGIFPERQLSADGFEMTFAVNHLGHFLLTLNLMPLLEKGKARIINVSSEAHKAAKPKMDDLQSEMSYKSIRAYANAKLFNIYFTQAIAKKYGDKGITAYSLHPGIVDTKFGEQYTGFFKWLLKNMRPFMVTPDAGAETTIYLASEPDIEKFNGNYFKKKQVSKTALLAQDYTLANALWDKSEALTKAYL